MCPWNGKQIANTIVGTEGTLRYSGFAGDPITTEGVTEWCFHRDNSSNERKVEKTSSFQFENCETGVSGDGDGPESVHAFIDGCLDKPFYNGADARIGFMTVATIDAVYRSGKSKMLETVAALE